MNILGVDLAGEVEAVGKDVRLFKKGDQVYGGAQMGCYAEYVAVSESALITGKPANMRMKMKIGGQMVRKSRKIVDIMIHIKRINK